MQTAQRDSLEQCGHLTTQLCTLRVKRMMETPSCRINELTENQTNLKNTD